MGISGGPTLCGEAAKDGAPGPSGEGGSRWDDDAVEGGAPGRRVCVEGEAQVRRSGPGAPGSMAVPKEMRGSLHSASLRSR